MKKLNKKQAEFLIDVSMTATIMADEGRLERVYNTNNLEWGVGGYMDSVYIFTIWAQEFLEKHKDTDWEKELFFCDKYEPLSKKWRDMRNDKFQFHGHYDDVLADWAEWKIENYDLKECKRIIYHEE